MDTVSIAFVHHRHGIDDAIIEASAPEFTMDLVGDDRAMVIRLVNIGIDSRLEACYIPEFGDKYEDVIERGSRRLKCRISPKSLVCLMHRLREDGTEEAETLYQDILSVLDIEREH